MNAQNVLDMVNRHTLMNLTDISQIEIFRGLDNILLQEWHDTHSFDVYKSYEYFYDCLFCYVYLSSREYEFVKNVLISEEHKDLSAMRAFDDYNGIGLTTLDMADDFGNVGFFNDNMNQVESMMLLADKCKSEYLINQLQSRDSFCGGENSIFFSLEIVEHYPRPMEYIDSILSLIPRPEYIALSHGFSNDKWCGHYTYYTVNNELVHFTKVLPILEQEILKRYSCIASGMDGRIKLYKLKSGGLINA